MLDGVPGVCRLIRDDGGLTFMPSWRASGARIASESEERAVTNTSHGGTAGCGTSARGCGTASPGRGVAVGVLAVLRPGAAGEVNGAEPGADMVAARCVSFVQLKESDTRVSIWTGPAYQNVIKVSWA